MNHQTRGAAGLEIVDGYEKSYKVFLFVLPTRSHVLSTRLTVIMIIASLLLIASWLLIFEIEEQKCFLQKLDTIIIHVICSFSKKSFWHNMPLREYSLQKITHI